MSLFHKCFIIWINILPSEWAKYGKLKFIFTNNCTIVVSTTISSQQPATVATPMVTSALPRIKTLIISKNVDKYEQTQTKKCCSSSVFSAYLSLVALPSTHRAHWMKATAETSCAIDSGTHCEANAKTLAHQMESVKKINKSERLN